MSSEKLDTLDMNDPVEGTARPSDATAIPYHDDPPRQSDATRLDDFSDKDINSKELEQAQTIPTRLPTFPKELERRVRRKLDWNIVPLITVIYMLSVLDRSNIGNAKIAGMEQDLNLTGDEYQWLLTIFYIPCTPSPSHLIDTTQISYLNG
jgi:hypothetical protein